MENQNKENILLKLVSNEEDWMDALRQNIGILRTFYGWSVRVLADKANISENTIQNILKNKTKDCEQSLTIKLAKTFNISVDELIGAGTVKQTGKESMAIYRSLPESDQYLARWFVNYLMNLNCEEENKSLYRSVMDIECFNGNLKLNSIYHRADISEVPAEIRTKIFFGIKMPCDHYMPVYSPYETLLIANDRLPMHNENCLIRVKKNVYIAKVKMEGTEMKFHSIRDGKFRLNRDEISEVVGYIAATIIEK